MQTARKKEYQRHYYKANAAKLKAGGVRNSRLKRTGYTQEEYDAAFYNQRGVCKLCGNPETTKGLAADHNHVTGIKRGLLCQSCNMGLGFFKENVRLLELAIKYLQDHG